MTEIIKEIHEITSFISKGVEIGRDNENLFFLIITIEN